MIQIPWFKVDDKLHSHPKARRAGLAALGLWSVAGSWSSEHTQEGFVPEWFVSTWPNGRKRAAELVDARLWFPDTRDEETGWRFHDWEHFQPSKNEVERDRAVNRDRQRRYREKRRKARLEALQDDA